MNVRIFDGSFEVGLETSRMEGLEPYDEEHVDQRSEACGRQRDTPLARLAQPIPSDLASFCSTAAT